MGLLDIVLTIAILTGRFLLANLPHLAFGADGKIRYCETLEIANWDDFHRDGTWKAGGLQATCDGEVLWRTSSACEGEDLYGATCD